jgi:hypothetical protein
MRLTELQIKALKPDKIRYAISDGRGLALEVMPTGGASWRYRYQFKGKTERVSLGKYPLVSLKAARSKRDELAKVVHEGVSPAKQKQLEKFSLANSTSVADFSELYFTEVIQKDRKDTKQLRRYLVDEICPAFGTWALMTCPPISHPLITGVSRFWFCFEILFSSPSPPRLCGCGKRSLLSISA